MRLSKEDFEQRFLTRQSKLRQPDILRETFGMLGKRAKPIAFNLGVGAPNPQSFPWINMKLGLRDGSEITLDDHLTQRGLQYQSTNGLPELMPYIRHLQERFHGVDFSSGSTEMAILAGGQDGLCKTLDMFMESGDPILTEAFTYPGTLAALTAFSPEFMVVSSDADGMQPESLRHQLESRGAERKPKVLCITPTGANPTGATLPIERRKQIYELCCQHDLLILEDDPYYFLHFDADNDHRLPSFLSMDTEGRVIRIDSFSKVLSSGIRIGFITAPKPLVDRIILHMQVSVLQASALSQVIVYSTLKKWGDSGFDEHVAKVAKLYETKRDLMCSSMRKHLSDLCEWHEPSAGMFIWLKVKGVDDTWDMIMKRGLDQDLMLIPGRCFMSSNQPEAERNSSHLRASYSFIPNEDIDKAIQRLAMVIKAEQELARSG